MSKAVIKIIKRSKEAVAEKVAVAPEVLGGRAKAENIAERRMAGVVAGWISERCGSKCAEEVSALFKISAWKNSSEIIRQ